MSSPTVPVPGVSSARTLVPSVGYVWQDATIEHIYHSTFLATITSNARRLGPHFCNGFIGPRSLRCSDLLAREHVSNLAAEATRNRGSYKESCPIHFYYQSCSVMDSV